MPNYFDDQVITIQTNGFDADSEGSDCELVPNTNRTTEERSTMNGKCQHKSFLGKYKKNVFFNYIIASSDHNGNPPMESLNVSEHITSNSTTVQTKSTSLPTTPCKQSMKRPRKTDATKFNHSDRESKNVGTFYFRHPDTEPETDSAPNNCNDCSSQDANSEVYSEDDQWIYTNGNDVNGNASALYESFVDENDLTAVSMQVNMNDSLIIDTVDGQSVTKDIDHEPQSNDENKFCKEIKKVSE